MTIPNDFNPLGLTKVTEDSTPAIKFKVDKVTSTRKNIRITLYRASRFSKPAGSIDWGDGTTTTVNWGNTTATSMNMTKTYSTIGLEPTIKVYGQHFTDVYLYTQGGSSTYLRLTQLFEVVPTMPCRLFEGSPMTYVDTSKIKNFNKMKNYSRFFYSGNSLVDVILDLNEEAENLPSMFMFCHKLKTVTGKNGKIFGNTVTNIGSMFYNCLKLEEINGTMDFSGIMTMPATFYNCQNLFMDIDSVQNSLDFDYLSDTMEAFYNCKKLYGIFNIDIWLNIGADNYPLSNYKDTFIGCIGLTNYIQIPESIGGPCPNMQLCPYYIEASTVYLNSRSFLIRRCQDESSNYPGTLMNIIVKELELPNSNTFTIERWSDFEMAQRQHC